MRNTHYISTFLQIFMLHKMYIHIWVYKKCGPAAQSKMRPRQVISKNGPGRILPRPHFSLFLDRINFLGRNITLKYCSCTKPENYVKMLGRENHFILSENLDFFAKTLHFLVIFSTQATVYCGNCCAIVSHSFSKNFVKVTLLLKKLLNS